MTSRGWSVSSAAQSRKRGVRCERHVSASPSSSPSSTARLTRGPGGQRFLNVGPIRAELDGRRSEAPARMRKRTIGPRVPRSAAGVPASGVRPGYGDSERFDRRMEPAPSRACHRSPGSGAGSWRHGRIGACREGRHGLDPPRGPRMAVAVDRFEGGSSPCGPAPRCPPPAAGRPAGATRRGPSRPPRIPPPSTPRPGTPAVPGGPRPSETPAAARAAGQTSQNETQTTAPRPHGRAAACECTTNIHQGT